MVYSLYRVNNRKCSIEYRINDRTTDWMGKWFKHLDKSIKQEGEDHRKLMKLILDELRNLNQSIEHKSNPKE